MFDAMDINGDGAAEAKTSNILELHMFGEIFIMIIS